MTSDDVETELARVAAETGEDLATVRDLHEAMQACGEEARFESVQEIEDREVARRDARYDELREHLRAVHHNQAAPTLDDREAGAQHWEEHNLSGGLRNHAEPGYLHVWRARNVWLEAPLEFGTVEVLSGDAGKLVDETLAESPVERTRPVPLARVVETLREMDLQQGRTSEHGGAEIAWFYWRNDVEDALGLKRGALCAANPDGGYAESDEDEPAAPEPSTEERERPGEYDPEHLRALRPGSQPLPTPSDRPSAHDLLLGFMRSRRELGLSRYGSLLQAGNGRDSLQDALEEVVDLAAYLVVWREARDEALAQLRQVRENLAGESTCFAEAQVELLNDAIRLLAGTEGDRG